jgi:hypothetical protein
MTLHEHEHENEHENTYSVNEPLIHFREPEHFSFLLFFVLPQSSNQPHYGVSGDISSSGTVSLLNRPLRS